MKRIRGTFEERQAARLERRRQRRVKHFLGLVRTARGPHQQLSHIVDYIKAIADDLHETQVKALTQELSQLADRWNQE